jgi:hypothetical protein
VGDNLPMNRRIRLVTQTAISGADDHIGQLEKIIPLRILDLDLADEILPRFIYPVFEVPFQLVSEVLASAAVNDDRCIFEKFPCILEHQSAGVFVE